MEPENDPPARQTNPVSGLSAITYYDKIAHLYDVMYNEETGIDHMAHVQWVDGWREKLGLPKTVLDLACGTGQHLARFESLGYTCLGIDASHEMLKIAACRLTAASLEHGYFHTFRLPQKVPLITCFFNSLAYNCDLEELQGALRQVRANLLDKGLFVFDIVCPSEPNPEPVFVVREFEGKGLRFSRTFVGIPTPEGFKSRMVYVVFDGTSSEVINETTVRGMYSADEVKQALEDCGFTVLYHGSGPLTSASVFVAQRV